MPLLDNADAVLAELRRQNASPRACDAVAQLRSELARIERERYLPERVAEEVAAARNACLAQVDAALAEMNLSIDAECEAAVEAREQERAKARSERRALRDVVDVDVLAASDDPRELLKLCADAADAGEETGAQARRIAKRRLEQLAAEELRRHRMNGVAFAALCQLSNAPQRATTSADIREQYEHKKREARRLVLAVAKVVDLDGVLGRAPVAAPPAAPAKSNIVVGGFFDKYPQLRRA